MVATAVAVVVVRVLMQVSEPTPMQLMLDRRLA